ncbi:bifunctional diaminohydroxyphosphoribosylaminopyrimidine deaminase/5-amino-6-(5-phosphoribosylamino)uracil reductase RibD [Actinospongicola halichondriae]|uniref:bifunctional diaminohydroxyphosphoribosylaminopyrimidine deaminase/5-amino-6-(5-phosphoribosylamino)uracil reductase RibD n=1 Tax=Actinospongicola halichondriae TaxID=3236844 RepID=UPI003D47265F
MLDEDAMRLALEVAEGARTVAHPNPWVGCVLLTPSGRVVTGATHAPGGPHAEAAALAAAGPDAHGATAIVTLEPCSFHGRTPACSDALIDAGVRRVVIAIQDPDERVDGEGVRRLREAGVEVEVGVLADAVERQLAPYLRQRRTGRPYVIAKLASSADGRTAAPDGSSRWITGREARADAHRLRAESDAVIVGAGTVRADDPALTVRHVEGPDPERIVLGSAPAGAAVRPCREMTGEPADILDELGREGMVQVMIEGGASVVGAFHRAGLVDRYVLYLAPVLFGGDDALGLFTGPGAHRIDDVWRGRIDAIEQLGADLRIELTDPDVAEN